METDRRKIVVLLGLLLILILPIGIVLAMLHEVEPAIPTVPGIEYAYNEGVWVDGSIQINYNDSSIRVLALPPKLSYYETGSTAPVQSVTVNVHTITVIISTQDPTAICEVSVEWKMEWSASASGKRAVKQNTYGSPQKLTLGMASGYSQSGTIKTTSYTVPVSDSFPSSPTQGQTSKWSHMVDVTATFKYTAGIGPLPEPFTRTASRNADIDFSWKQSYTYSGSTTVSGKETTTTTSGGTTTTTTTGGEPTMPPSPYQPGCPYLYQYDGNKYKIETLLTIHGPEGIDIQDRHRVQDLFIDKDGFAKLMLEEELTGHSFIDEVNLSNAELILAWHEKLGDVTFELLEDDDIRTDIKPTEKIFLVFKIFGNISDPGIFTIQGYNYLPKSLLPMRPLQTVSDGRKVLVIGWEYILLEIVGLVLIGLPYIPYVKEWVE